MVARAAGSSHLIKRKFTEYAAAKCNNTLLDFLTTSRRRDAVLLFLLCAAFIAAGWTFIRRFGIEVDEALVGNGIYPRAAAVYSWKIGDAEIPLMLLSYLGALKTWMYNLIFAVWTPGPIPLRLPTLVFGAATIVLFFVILQRAAGRRAAWIGALLLASDPSFFLNEAIDFGPVALHHLLKLAALWLLIRFVDTDRRRFLVGAAFLLGLAMWDKAIFAWSLAGLTTAIAVIYPRELWQRCSIRNLGLGAAGFLIGAAPLLAYNIARPLDTFRSNAHFSPGDAFGKNILLRTTVNGSAMFGFLTAPLPGPNPGQPAVVPRVIADTVGRTTNFNLAAALLALAAIPLLWRTRARRPMLAALVYLVVTWIQMAGTAGAGAAAHHVLLLWPAHLLLIALALNQVRVPRLVPGLVLLLVGANVVVLNQYAVELARNGTSVRWTDAFPDLMRVLAAEKTERVFVADWGILETVNLMTEGTVPVVGIGEPDIGAALFAQPNDVFVSHGAPFVQFPQIGAKLEQTATALGFERVPVAAVYDRNGRGIFEVFRYRRR